MRLHCNLSAQLTYNPMLSMTRLFAAAQGTRKRKGFAMWNRSSMTEKKIRLAAGALTLVCAVTLPFVLSFDSESKVSAASAAAGQVGEISSGLGQRDDRRFRINMDGVELAKIEGTIVYQRLPNGTGEIIGRVHKDDQGYWLQLPPALAKLAPKGGALLYAEPVFYLDEAVPIVLAPDGLQGEFQIAYDELWPVVDEQLIQPIRGRLRTEVKALLQEIMEEEEEQATAIAQELFEELSPEIDELGDRVTTRAWDEIGVWGVTVGAARKVLGAAEKGIGKVKELFGGEDNSDGRSFLSEERKAKLKAAIVDELTKYWDEQGDKIKDKTATVLGNHEDEFTTKVEDVWLPRLFDRAVMPEWNHQQDKLLLRVSKYLEDMANRRLVTEEGSLMLPLAYTFRTAAEITDRPLLVFQPGDYNTPGELQLLPFESHLDPTK